MKLILLGPPGAGKGTQADKIKTKFNIPHISTGDILRSNVRNNTELGIKAKTFMDAGELVPDSLIFDMVEQRFAQPDCQNGFLLDGFPRNTAQAKKLDEMLSKSSGIDTVICITVDPDILIDRAVSRRVCKNCGTPYNIKGKMPKIDGVCDICSGEVIHRPDDNEDTIKNRVRVYQNETAPLIDYYESQGKLRNIDGEQSPEDVSRSIEIALGE